jgi:hypothetical protein
MKPKAQERGQALVIIALAVVGLFGFSALAIDGSRVFSDRRNAQNAADTAALSAALAKIRGTGTDYVDAATDRASSNGYVTDTNSTVEVSLCSALVSTPDACQGIPTTTSTPPTPDELALIDPANYIQVKITSIIPATFARIVGRQEFKNIVTAVSYAGPVKPKPLVNGAALAALKEDGDKTLFGNGVVTLDVINSGVFNNSADNCATTISGAASQYTVDTAFQFVSGTYCSGAGNTALDPVNGTSPIDYPPKFNIPKPTVNCSGTGSYAPDPANPTTLIFSPGNFSGSINLNHSGGIIFKPGNYCFSDNVKIGGTAQIIANSVRFKLTGGEFSTAGASEMTCNDMLVYIAGGTGLHFNGASRVYCNSVTFYAETGSVSWNGNLGIRLFAPEGGDYKNLLIYMPYPNSSELAINGNSDNELTGSIIAVRAPIKISGVSGTTGLHSQIIGWTVELKGASNTVINYVPEEQWMELDPSAVTLTK